MKKGDIETYQFLDRRAAEHYERCLSLCMRYREKRKELADWKLVVSSLDYYAGYLAGCASMLWIMLRAELRSGFKYERRRANKMCREEITSTEVEKVGP